MRAIALELLYRLRSNLVADTQQQLEPDERELIMAIVPLFQQKLEAVRQQAREEGWQEGFKEGLELGRQERGREEQQRLILENFLRIIFAEMPSKMTALLPPTSRLPVAEFTVLLLVLSMLTVDEIGLDRTVTLLAENSVKIRSNELGELLTAAVTNFLALSEVELTLFVEQMPQLSADDLRERLEIKQLTFDS